MSAQKERPNKILEKCRGGSTFLKNLARCEMEEETMNWTEVFESIKERTLVGGCPPEVYDEYIKELLGRGYDELEAHKTAYAVLACYDAHARLAKLD